MPLSELQKSYTLVQQAREALAEADQVSATAQAFLTGIEKDFHGTVIHYLAAKLYQGDEQKAYEHVLKEAGKLVGKFIQLQRLPPAEREALSMKQELERERTRRAELEKTLKEQEDLDAEMQEGEQLVAELKPVMKKLGIPLTPRMYETIGDVLQRLEERFLETGRAEFKPPLESVVKLVRDRLASQVAEGLNVLPLEDVLRLRPNLEEEVNQRVLARVRANGSTRAPKVGATAAPEKPGPPKVRVFRDFEDLFKGD